MPQMSASWTSLIWLAVRSMIPRKMETCCVIKSVAKVTPKISPRYLERSPVSIFSAIPYMGALRVVCLAPGPAQPDFVLGAQGHQGDRLSFCLPGGRFQLQMLQQGRRDQRHFHHGKRVADADAWSAAEREVGELREILVTFGQETVRLKFLRFREPARVALADVGKQLHQATLG